MPSLNVQTTKEVKNLTSKSIKNVFGKVAKESLKPQSKGLNLWGKC